MMLCQYMCIYKIILVPGILLLHTFVKYGEYMEEVVCWRSLYEQISNKNLNFYVN